MTTNKHKCGYVAIIGRPNVGKSTLLNQSLGQKISITSSKPQTTRHNILGIKTIKDAQILYLDTPGIHMRGDRAMNRYLNQNAQNALAGADLVMFLVAGTHWGREDQKILENLKQAKIPVILVVNKVDLIKEKDQLLPHLQWLGEQMSFLEIIPLSAKSPTSVDEVERSITKYLPEADAFYAEDQVTDRSIRFLAAEIIREKITRLLGQEIPYATSVEIEFYAEDADLIRISALIWVEREGQKNILIGKKGQMLKNIGMQARKDLEKLLDQRVYLKLWSKVKVGWADDVRALRSLGYDS